MTDDDPTQTTDVSNPYQTGDPVVDLAQGRPMIVLDAPDETAREWSDRENYELAENYANGKLDTTDDDAVVRCVYVSDIRSEPSKDYTFPTSRVALIDAHHADDGRRVAERVRLDLLESMMRATVASDREGLTPIAIGAMAEQAGVSGEVIDVALELANVEQVIGDV